jgi:hypothetical protein
MINLPKLMREDMEKVMSSSSISLAYIACPYCYSDIASSHQIFQKILNSNTKYREI